MLMLENELGVNGPFRKRFYLHKWSKIHLNSQTNIIFNIRLVVYYIYIPDTFGSILYIYFKDPFKPSVSVNTASIRR